MRSSDNWVASPVINFQITISQKLRHYRNWFCHRLKEHRVMYKIDWNLVNIFTKMIVSQEKNSEKIQTLISILIGSIKFLDNLKKRFVKNQLPIKNNNKFYYRTVIFKFDAYKKCLNSIQFVPSKSC